VSPAALPTRAIVRIVLTIAVTIAALYLLWLVRSVVELFCIAVFLAVAMGPGVDAIQRRLRLPRPLSIVSMYLAVAAAIVGIGLLVVPPIVTQVEQFSSDIPGYLDDLRANKTFRKYDDKYDITKKLRKQAETLPNRLGDAAGALRDITVGVFSALVQLITVLTMTFLLLLDGRRIAGFLLRLRGPEREQRFRTIALDIYRSTAGYVAGNLIISVIAGVVSYVTMTILDVPFAVPLAVLVAFLDLIPLVGATIGAVAVGVVTAFNDFPTATIIWAIVSIVYQQVENNLIQPLVYRRTVSVAPLIVIVSILVGSSLLGVLGALVAIPVAAAVQIVLRDLWSRYEGDEDEDESPSDGPPELPPHTAPTQPA
jgi:predicted PurR-regulated permease PerM